MLAMEQAEAGMVRWLDGLMANNPNRWTALFLHFPLFSIDPVMGLVIGWLVMGQTISSYSLAGIVVVAAAGALLVWISGGHAKPASS